MSVCVVDIRLAAPSEPSPSSTSTSKPVTFRTAMLTSCRLSSEICRKCPQLERSSRGRPAVRHASLPASLQASGRHCAATGMQIVLYTLASQYTRQAVTLGMVVSKLLALNLARLRCQMRLLTSCSFAAALVASWFTGEDSKQMTLLKPFAAACTTWHSHCDAALSRAITCIALPQANLLNALGALCLRNQHSATHSSSAIRNSPLYRT